MTRVLVPLAQGCEELEAVTIIDLLRRAGIEVIAAGLESGPVTASRGVRLLPDMTLDEATVLKHCSERLAKFKQPQSVRFIEEIPHNATGKVLKRELRQN